MSVRYTPDQLAAIGKKPPSAARINAAEYQEQAGKKKRNTAVKWTEPKQTESQMQAECVAWFRQEFPEFANNCFAVPNGGFRNPKNAAILKREGVLSGVPDVCVAVARRSYHGLYLELKIKGNKPTENQLAVMRALSEQGYKCEVIYSFFEFKQAITNYLKTNLSSLKY